MTISLLITRFIAIPKRLWRWLRIAMTVRRLRRSHTDDERALARRALAEHFAGARGITMKIGQLMAGNNDTDNIFTPLVKGIEPLPLAQLLPLIEQSLGQSVTTVFTDIEPIGKAASLGQVHRAKLHDGTAVAIKVRYPFIEDAVKAEMRLAGLIPGLGPVRRWGMNLDAYRETLRLNMEQELDYCLEAKQQTAYRQNVQVSGLIVPEVFTAYSSQSLLITSWQDGVYLDETITWPLRQRLLIGRTLLLNLFTSMFVHGEVHGDPHLGNALYRQDQDGIPQVALLDFGCTIKLSKQRRLAWLKIIYALKEGEQIALIPALIAADFDASKLVYLNDELPGLCQALFHPFLVEGVFKPEDWQLSRTVLALLGERRWWFRAAGPSDSMLLVRAFEGIITQLATLNIHLPWWAILKNTVNEDLWQQARDMPLPELPAEIAALGNPELHPAKHLRVQIWPSSGQAEDAEIDVCIPAVSAMDLPTLMPDAALAAVSRLPNNNLTSLPDRLRREGLQPQELFNFEMDGKSHRIWLE
ncbi:MAG: AarF/UbiB family protein [Mariprofundales bacterium]